MRPMFRPALLAAAVAVTAAAPAGCATSPSVDASCVPAHHFPTISSGTLSVSVYVSPPYSVQQGNDDYAGIDVDIIKRIAERECLEVEFFPVAGAGAVQSVRSGRSDAVIGGLYRTPERAEVIGLSATMYRDGMSLMSRDGASTVDSLRGRTVGVVQGYLWNADLQKTLGVDAVTTYPSSVGLLTDLRAGRVQVGVLTGAEAAYRASQPAGAGLRVTQIVPDPRILDSVRPTAWGRGQRGRPVRTRSRPMAASESAA